MTNKISELFGIKLSKAGKLRINRWIDDEFGSLYHAQKKLETDQDIVDFVNDMLKDQNMSINDLTDKNSAGNVKIIKKARKQFKYCPYCGERID